MTSTCSERAITVARVFVALALFLCATQMFARARVAEGSEDLQSLGASAQFIFHANVISFDSTEENGVEKGFAILHVDRWYKGKAEISAIRLRFRFVKFAIIDGHDCIDLHRTDSWLIFAARFSGDLFDFSDDCEGGLPMSQILSPSPRGSWDQQLQQDLIAGLRDPDSSVRLANIARLGGLKLASSAAPLHDFITSGSEIEKKWPIYAALRSGDLSVLPQVEAIVISISGPLPNRPSSRPVLTAAPQLGGAYPDPDASIALELQHIRDPRAVPTLIRILNSAKTDLVRECAGQALEEMGDPRSARAAAAALNDPSRYVRYDAIVLLWKLTKAPECAIPDGSFSDVQSAPYYERCKAWWRTVGNRMPWPRAQ